MLDEILANPVTALIFAVVAVFVLTGMTVVFSIWIPMAYQFVANISRNMAENNSQAGRRLDEKAGQ